MSHPPSEGEADGQTLWHGRFGTGPAGELLAFTVSLPFDQRLATDDIAGSRAHVAMLEHVGLLTAEERSVSAAFIESLIAVRKKPMAARALIDRSTLANG